eukprot:TRINITY_DN94350_c0_g1_i1.p1 TRINITY_DN94350_c0_g1~~TRINITY_DN94350_c0_g1_i1.p1  ORF type:complete len:394 (-),score=48.34 TRINITY_DN94350_c0_g1_i1:155-1336(-)
MMFWVRQLMAVLYPIAFLVGIPLLMQKSRYLSLIVPVAYGICSWLQWWESVATHEIALTSLFATFNAIPCWAFYSLSVEPAELIMEPVLLMCLGIAIAFAVNSSTLGCSAPAAYSSNISFIAGNILWQGYVYMFVVLVLLPIIFILRLKVLKPYADAPKTYTRLIIFGFCCSTLTGVFPWLADRYACNDQIQVLFLHLPSCSTFHDDLHMSGFIGGIALCSVGAVLMCYFAVQPHMDKLNSSVELSSSRSYKELNMVLNHMIVFIILLVCFFTEFGILFSLREQLSKPELCTLYSTPSSCSGSLVPNETYQSIVEHTGWPCVWNATQPTSSLLSQCTDPNCNEGGRFPQNAAAVVCEFLVICCWLYIVSLAILVCEEVQKLFVEHTLLVEQKP